MKLKNCKVGQIVTHKKVFAPVEVVAVNRATIDIQLFNTIYHFVKPKRFKLIQ